MTAREPAGQAIDPRSSDESPSRAPSQASRAWGGFFIAGPLRFYPKEHKKAATRRAAPFFVWLVVNRLALEKCEVLRVEFILLTFRTAR